MSFVVIAVTTSILVMIFVAYCMRNIYQRMNEEKTEKIAIRAKQEEIRMMKMNAVKNKKQ